MTETNEILLKSWIEMRVDQIFMAIKKMFLQRVLFVLMQPASAPAAKKDFKMSFLFCLLSEFHLTVSFSPKCCFLVGVQIKRSVLCE